MNSKEGNKEATYFETLTKGTGCTTYKFSNTPLEIPQAQFNNLNQAVRSMLDLVDTDAYFEQCKQRDFWSLPTVPMKDTDFHGCADFLLTEDGAKLIEMNINLPGKVGLMETLGKVAQKWIKNPKGMWTNLNFNEQLKLEVEAALPKSQKIAIVVSHLESSQVHGAHYQYFSEQLNQEGLDTTVVYANEIVAHEDGCSWNGTVFDGVINLVIPFVWESNQHEFKELTKLLQLQPDCIFPSPTGGMLGTKDLLNYLSSKRNEKGAEVWREKVLFAKSLNSFKTVAGLLEVLTPEQIVLKPFKDYGAEGVYVQPNQELIEDVFKNKKNEYMVQEYTESVAKKIDTESDEIVECHSIIYRIFFASKKPFGYQAYYLTGDLSGAYHSAPVMVIVK